MIRKNNDIINLLVSRPQVDSHELRRLQSPRAGDPCWDHAPGQWCAHHTSAGRHPALLLAQILQSALQEWYTLYLATVMRSRQPTVNR